MIVLIGATPLVALCDARDEKHRVAVKHLELLASSQLMACEAVLTEACFRLPYASQRRRLAGLLETLGVQPVPVGNESDFRLEVFGWLAKYSDHDPGWADGCLAVLSGKFKDAKVWTYHREFKTIWRRPNGTVIPLAVRPS